MPYTLERLAAGSFDVLLNGEVVGSLVCEVFESGLEGDWLAEALADGPPFPAPFTLETHRFPTLRVAADWLDADVPPL